MNSQLHLQHESIKYRSSSTDGMTNHGIASASASSDVGDGQPENIMYSPTLLDGESIKTD